MRSTDGSEGRYLRLAVVSTPRAGNMWLRRQLVQLYGLEEVSAHTPGEVDWGGLPERCVLQIHWPRTRPFRTMLRRNRFRVVALARHPLDVLLSILQFAPHEPETARWLDGLYGDEEAIIGATPVSRAFLEYATGPRARALLDVSMQWWRHDLVSLRYEDLVSDPARQLRRIAEAVGVPPVLRPEDVGEAVTFGGLKDEARNRHFWQGQPYHWRELLPAHVAEAAAAPYTRLLHTLGYSVDPDKALTDEVALACWNAKLSR